ncbi:MAG: N-acetyltransferase [Opitutaceae bacterium]|nr:N-acetyltransferase [Opitutaceae bacterium]
MASTASLCAGLPATLVFGGRVATLRRLRPDDGPRLIGFFQSHTPETIHQRYGYLITQMSPERAARLVGVNQARDAALGVFEKDEGHIRLAAVGRYCLLDDGQSAELAFVVREDRRQLGMARALLKKLTAIARLRGLTRFVAQVQRDNLAMLQLFREHRAQITEIPGAGAVEASIAL